MTAREGLTARYLTRFQCLGAACEDTCCQAWHVPLDRRRFQILRKAMDGSGAERSEFRAAVGRTDGQGRPGYAHILLDDDGRCPFLTRERLCSVQARYGERAMPAVCASYPRLVVEAGGRPEVWGGISCPEMARQCLLHEDAMELVAAPRELPWEAARVLSTEAPYDRHLDSVRDAARAILSLRERPIGTRLFLLAYLGKESAAFFHRNAGGIDETRLEAIIAHVCQPATVALWARELAAMPPPRALTANLVGQLIGARRDLESRSFRRLLEETLESYRADGGATRGPDDAWTVEAGPLWASYAARRDRWQTALPGRVDLYLENYAKNFWMREWYTTSVDLLAHTRRLLVRVAVLRFLLFGHPSLRSGEVQRDVQRDLLDHAAVEVFYKVSRVVEHQATFLDRIAAAVVADGEQTFVHSTFLALV